MVEDIEELRPELITDLFCDPAVLIEGEVPVSSRGSPDRVPSRIAKSTRCSVDKAVGVEPLRDISWRAIGVATCHAVGGLPKVGIHSRDIASGIIDGVRHSAFKHHY